MNPELNYYLYNLHLNDPLVEAVKLVEVGIFVVVTEIPAFETDTVFGN